MEFAGAAGYTPAEVDKMSLWEFLCLQSGWQKSRQEGEAGPTAPTEDEYQAALERFGVAG